jgi:UDP-3-O-[3-hydroxymyristoyl] glucosamine N-acyltransferase
VTCTVRHLAALVQGTVVGDGDLVINAARPVGEAQAGDITFLEDEKHANLLQGCRASAAVVPRGLAFKAVGQASSLPADGRLEACPTSSLTVIQVRDPLGAFATLVRHLHGLPEPAPHGIDPLAAIHPTAKVGKDASIFPFAAIGEGAVLGERCCIHSGAVVGRHCRLGDEVTLHPGAVLYEGTILGNRVIIHANAVVGADGFGYRFVDGRHVKVPQLGHVEIGDDVEIGACTTIDRGTFQATRIGAGTKMDNLIQVGHNCQIGQHNLFVSQMGIAGSSTTGDYVVIAGQVGIVDHIHIGARAMIGAKAGVIKDVPEGLRMLGAPARPERDQKRILMSLDHLPTMRRDLQRIKQHLGLADEAA